jgi:hypothetical protein
MTQLENTQLLTSKKTSGQVLWTAPNRWSLRRRACGLQQIGLGKNLLVLVLVVFVFFEFV